VLKKAKKKISEEERMRMVSHFLAYEWQALCIDQAELDETPQGYVRVRAKLETSIANHKHNLSSASLGVVPEDSGIGSSFVKLGEEYRGR
jgi:hypothetical protein